MGATEKREEKRREEKRREEKRREEKSRAIYHINYLQQGKLEFDYEWLGVIQYRSFQTIVVPQQIPVQASLAFPLLRD
ncbi:hypothetical protein HGM15179_017100 [Zosterops borbonicus]|uniref:Uncharacterized protein n=1 Tax=Zosterops borbonicus TaxID=364589 RepID=A0A8K1LDN7_9PASS|nr:hypothetical protein HGM15179_017100 [Zosterops borbonicus]